jgi:hypothetical protein
MLYTPQNVGLRPCGTQFYKGGQNVSQSCAVHGTLQSHLSRDLDVYPSNHKRPPPILPHFHSAILLTSRSSDQHSVGPKFKLRPADQFAPSGSTAIKPSLHRPVPPPSDHDFTVWFHRSKTMLAPPGSTAVRPRLHHLVPLSSDHACTAWFHRPQNTLVTSGPIVQKPLKQLPQLTPNVNRTALQLTGWYLTVPQFHTKQQ